MSVDATTRKHAVQWRALIGPPYLPDTDAAHWDWSALSLAAYAPVPVETRLASSLAAAATSLVLPTGVGAGWPTAGGCWVGPGKSGEAWEYVRYTGRSTDTLTGLVREAVDAEQTGVHGVGARVRFWWQIISDSGKLELSEQMDASLSSVGWSVTLAGFDMPLAALRTGHLCVIQARWITTDGWGAWQNELIGWLDSPKLKDNSERLREWSVNVVGLDGVLSTIEVPGVRVGASDLGRQAEMSSDSTLSVWYKEQGSGEFVQSEPNLGPEQANDGDDSTPWISERYIGDDNTPTNNGFDLISISPHVGQAKGYRFLQIKAANVSQVGWGIKLLPHTGIWPGTGETGIGWNTSNNPLRDDLQTIVFCENASLFQQEHPDMDDPYIYEISSGPFWQMNGFYYEEVAGYTAAQWWDALLPAGGYLRAYVIDGVLEQDHGVAVWGSPGVASVEGWTGPFLPALAPGQTIRREWDVYSPAETRDYWSVGQVDTGGYWVNGAQLGWIAAKLQPMGLRLTNDATASSPAAAGTLYLSGPAGPCVDGLPASGTIQVGAEQITYSAKTPANDGLVITARGANSTTAAVHLAGDTVQFVESGVATNAGPITEVELGRKTGQPVVKSFILRASKYDTVRYPGEDDYTDDWETLVDVTANALSVYTLTLASTRYRHLLQEIRRMGTDPYRPMLNTFKVRGDAAVYQASHLTNATVADAMTEILNTVGVPSGAIVDANDTPTVDDYTTEQGMAWQIMVDLADYTGCRVTVGRDSKITLQTDPYWSAGVMTETQDWTRLEVSAFEQNWQSGRAVGQIELEWIAADAGARGTVKYPTLPDTFGAVVKIGPRIYANGTAALAAAQKIYWQQRRPYGALVEAAGAPFALRAGEIHGALWPVDGEMLDLDRSYIVQAAGHGIDEGGLASVFHLLQVSRENER